MVLLSPFSFVLAFRCAIIRQKFTPSNPQILQPTTAQLGNVDCRTVLWLIKIVELEWQWAARPEKPNGHVFNIKILKVINKLSILVAPLTRLLDTILILKDVFHENSALIYGWYPRVVCNQERFIMAHIRYLKRIRANLIYIPLVCIRWWNFQALLKCFFSSFESI